MRNPEYISFKIGFVSLFQCEIKLIHQMVIYFYFFS